MTLERLGDVAELIRGVTFDGGEATRVAAQGLLPILRAGNIAGSLILDRDLVWVPEARVQAEQRLRQGDIAICLSSGSASVVGKTALLDRPFEGAVGAFCGIVRSGPRLDPAYLSAWFRSPAYRSWRDSQSRGANIQNLRLSTLSKVELPVPVLAEQRRVATALGSQLATAERARMASAFRRLEVDRLRVCLVRSAIPLPPDGPWPWLPVRETAEFLDSIRKPISATVRAARVRGKPTSSLYPYFGANGQAGWIDDFLFNEPLVLLAEDGGAFGSESRPIAYRVNGKVWVNNHAHVLRPRPNYDVDFLGHALAIRPDVGDLISGSTRGKLNQRVAAAIMIPVPPLHEQRRIAAQLGESLAALAPMANAVERELEAIEALPAVLFSRQFGDVAA